MIDLLKLFVCIAFLLYSCYSDLRTRTVRNELWGVVIVAALPLVIADIVLYGKAYLLHTLVSVTSVYLFVYILFRLNAFGGADAKALIALSFIFPYFPDIAISGHELPLSGTPPLNIFAFSTLVNAVLLTIVVPLGILAYNLCTLSMHEILKRPFYLVVGYKCPVSGLRDRHIKLIENYIYKDGKVRQEFSRSGVVIDDSVMRRLEQLTSRGLIGDRVWVTPGLPFMIPITAGFISATLYGDMMFHGVMLFLCR